MSKRKFTLPHSDEKIKEMEEQAKALRIEIEIMIRDNWKAKNNEELRKARIVTPSMLEVLMKLAEGSTITVSRWRRKLSVSIKMAIFDRLRTAQFIVLDKERSRYLEEYYVITDLGRQALEAAKQKEATK